MTQFDDKYRNQQTSFFIFLIFAKIGREVTAVTHTHARTHAHTQTHTHTNTHTHTYAHTHARTNAHTHTHTYTHSKRLG